MPNPRPRSLTRPADVVATETFTDPLLHPEAEWNFCFLAQSGSDFVTLYNERVATLIDDWLPKTDADGKPEPPKCFLPPFDGHEAIITERLCRIVAMLMLMEQPPAGEAPYSFQDWVELGVVSPTVFDATCLWAEELWDAARNQTKNLSRASTESPSAPPSTTAPDTIPKFSPAATPTN